MNARSLIPILTDLKNFIVKNQFHIVGITESWLTTSIEDAAVNIDGYNLVRLDREGRGGGVILYIRDIFKFEILHSEIQDYIEHIWVNLTLNNKSIVIGVDYHPPNTSGFLFLECLENILSDYEISSDLTVCLGDFNINYLDNSNALNINLFSILNSLNLKEIIERPKRVTHSTSSLLDFIITSDNARIIEGGLIDTLDFFCRF